MNLTQIPKINLDENVDYITPEKYELIKCVQYKKYKWILFKNKNINENNNNNNINNNNNNIDDKDNIKDYIWIYIDNEKKFDEFGQIQFNNSNDLLQQIEELKDYQATLLTKLSKKEKEYNSLNLNFAKLINRKKTGDINQDRLIETIEKLRRENKTLQTTMKNMKQGDNFIGISFIEEDVNNNSQFIDDYNFDDIIDDLNNIGIFTYGNNNGNKLTNNLINSVDSLLGQIDLTQNVKLTLASIFKQLGLSDEDIYQLIGKFRSYASNSKNKG